MEPVTRAEALCRLDVLRQKIEASEDVYTSAVAILVRHPKAASDGDTRICLGVDYLFRVMK